MGDVAVKVIGAGGVGGALLPTLCRVLNYGATVYQFDDVTVGVIDGDEYEDRNRDRQSFSEKGNKAKLTVDRLKPEYDNVVFESFGLYLTKDNIADIIKEGNVVFCCVDNHTTRLLVSKHCQTLDNITIISGGNELFDGNIQVYVRRNGVDITPAIEKNHKEIANPNDENPAYVERKAGCDALVASAPQLLIVNANVAMHMLNAFQSYLLDELGKWDELFFDTRSWKTRPKKFPVEEVKVAAPAEAKTEEKLEEVTS
jgi:molybdopterin/thiamine biosynthesis adenylyltransferase